MTATFESPAEQRARPIAPLPKPVSFEQFINWYPENSEYRYELRRGVVFQVPKPRGKHSELAGNLAKRLNYAIDAKALPYIIPRECIVKVDDNTGYEPDVIVLKRDALSDEPLWQKASTVEKGASVKLVIEVVSSNWQDDYEVKLAAYESVAIAEYWIVDYAGLGGFRHIGRPKQPTLTVCKFIEGEYEVTRLRGEDLVESSALPGLEISAYEILSL
ncbi:MAG: Uma2 family endonuclease [Cyanobacteria bacterium J06560_6]